MYSDNCALLYGINLYVIGCFFGNLFHCCNLQFENQLRGCEKCFNLYRINVTPSVTQCMHDVFQLSPCLLETETQTNSTVVPTTGLAFVRSHYVIYGGLGSLFMCALDLWDQLRE